MITAIHTPAKPCGMNPPGNSVQVVEADGGHADAEDVDRAEDDEQHDRRHLDHREPVLERAEVAHRARVHVEQDEREGERPDPHRHARKPVGHVDAGGDRFAADGDHLRDPIGVADDEARPRD